MVFAMRSWSANTDSDTESGAKKLKLELKLKVKSRPSEKIKRKATRVLSLSHLGAALFLRAGEQANHLREMEDTAIMLRKQVEELEAKVSMANLSERRLMDILSISEDRRARTKKELALMREKMDEADCRIEYLEAAVSRYQNRIAVAEVEKEKAEERACGASVGGETMSTPRPSPAAPRSTSLSFVPSPSPRLTDSELCKESALFPELTYY